MKLRLPVTAAALAIPVSARAAGNADDQAQPEEIIVTGTAQERYDFRDTGTITRPQRRERRWLPFLGQTSGTQRSVDKEENIHGCRNASS